MKILVAATEVFDPSIPLRLETDGLNFEPASAKLLLNPFDEVALNQAVIMKKLGQVTETIAVTIGLSTAMTTVLRPALALGIDRAIYVPFDGPLDGAVVANILRAVVEKEEPDLVIAGRQTSDNGMGQVGPYLAAKLCWAQATAITKLEVVDHGFHVASDMDGDTETRMISMPAVVSVNLSLNTPPYLSLPSIMKARKAPIERCSLEDLQVEPCHTDCRSFTIGYQEPPRRKAGIRIPDAQALAPIVAQVAGLAL
ncbi:MAG: electron transfer flavoprotein subunit beta/FixA family protein [Alphaproteobacteria bacterium]